MKRKVRINEFPQETKVSGMETYGTSGKVR